MWLVRFFILLSLNGFSYGLSNDIVGSLRCKLICNDIECHDQELTEGGICRCTIAKELKHDDLTRIQHLSTLYKLPVMLLMDKEQGHRLLKRETDNSLIDNLREKLDEHKQQWDDNIESLRQWKERKVEDFDWQALKEKHMEQLEPIVAKVAPGLDQHKQQWEENMDKLRSWKEEQLEQLEPMLGQIAPVLEEHKQNWEDNLDKLRSWRDQRKDELQPFLQNVQNAQQPEETWNFDKIKSWGQPEKNEPLLGQMAPSLTTYDSKATGIGGSNVNFPKPDHPNPFIPPLAHIIHALPIPRVTFPMGSPGYGVGAPPPFPITPPFPSVHSRSAVSLPSRYAGPYNPNNPIVVHPIIMPPLAEGSPKPILGSLSNAVGDIVKNMKKNGGKLLPENYVNSDALSNSESQVNQINVNVRFEPTPTPPNLYSMFMPWNGRNWLLAPAPKDVETDAVTENPGAIHESRENGEDEDNHEDSSNTQDADSDDEQSRIVDSDKEEALHGYDDEENPEERVQQLKDIDETKFDKHIVESIKRNLNKIDQPKMPPSYNGDIIVQPKELQYSEEDLETLAK